MHLLLKTTYYFDLNSLCGLNPNHGRGSCFNFYGLTHPHIQAVSPDEGYFTLHHFIVNI